MREREERLVALGLIRELPPPLDNGELDATQRGTFAVILGDREQKLQPFEPVVARSERLLKSLNHKLAPKVVKLHVEAGYRVVTAAGGPLPLSCLSSGEQHELVLLHELLFDVAAHSLILIDEPELSLDVSWQEEMMRDLIDIARIADLDFVLATHSPYIAGEGDPRMVRLGPAA